MAFHNVSRRRRKWNGLDVAFKPVTAKNRSTSCLRIRLKWNDFIASPFRDPKLVGSPSASPIFKDPHPPPPNKHG